MDNLVDNWWITFFIHQLSTRLSTDLSPKIEYLMVKVNSKPFGKAQSKVMGNRGVNKDVLPEGRRSKAGSVSVERRQLFRCLYRCLFRS